MGSFGGGLETLGYEFDPNSIVHAISLINKNIEGMEGTTEKGAASMKRDWESVLTVLTKFSDKSKNSADSYIRSLERQAAAIGKSGIDKLNAQMDQAIKNYGYSESAINKITAAYDRMRQAQERASKTPPPHQESGSEINSRFLIFGAKDLLEGRTKNAAAEAVNVLQGLQGAPAILGAAVAGFAAVTGAVYEGSKALAEWAVQQKEIELKTGLSAQELGQYSYAAKAVGTDVSVVERLMRGLTVAVEDTSVKGEKARDVLRGMGVDVQGLREGIVPTGQVLQQISVAFKENGDVLSRNKEALDLFKRAGIEAVPFLTELDANLKHATDAGFGFDQATIDAGAHTQRVLADMGVRWDHVKLKIEDAATSILGLITNTTKFDDVFSKYEEFQLKQADLKSGVPDISKLPTSGFLVTLNNSRMQRDLDTTESGLERQLSAARAAAESASETYFTSTTHGPTDKARDAWVRAESDVRKYTEALKDLHEEERKKPEKEFIGPVFGPEIVQAHRLQQMVNDAGRALPANPGNNLEDVKDWLEKYKEQQKEQESAQKATLSFEEQLIKLRNGPDGEVATAKQVYDLRMQTATSVLEQYQAGLDYLKQMAEYQSKADQDHQAELDKQAKQQQQALEKEHDAVQKTATGLYDTLLTHPTQFGKQLENTIRKQTTSFAAEGLGKATADALVPGGVKNKELADVTDLNTDATRANTEAVGAMVNYLAGLLGVSAPSMRGVTGIPAVPPRSTAGGGGGSSIITIPLGLGGGSIPIPSGATFGGATIGGPSGLAPMGGFNNNSSVTSRISFPDANGNLVPASGTTSLPYFGASSPLFSSSTDVFGSGSGFSGTGAGSFGYGSFGGFHAGGGGGSVAASIAGTALRAIGGAGGFGAGNPATMIGPGGTSGFAGPVGGTAGGGWAGALSGLKGFGSNLGPAFGVGQGGMSSDVPASDSDNPLGPQMAPGGSTTLGSVATSPAVTSIVGGAGLKIAENGLLGNDRGTWAGTFQGAAGGAMVGFQYGGPIGAAIGAAVGFDIGIGEQLAGVVSPQNRVKDLVKSEYHVTISSKVADQIVALAKQKYANQLATAVHSPEVRQMLGLYAAGTGQGNASLLSNLVPHGGSLVEQGGQLYQQANYMYGQGYTYQSSLPVLGGPTAGNYPNPAGGSPSVQNVTISLNGQSAADALEGRVASVVTPSYLADGFSQANASSNGRVQAAADLSQPGLVTG